MNKLNKDIVSAYMVLQESEGPHFAPEITPEIEAQAKKLDKESKLMVDDNKKVSIAFMLGEELVGAVWTAWDTVQVDIPGEPEYSKGFDIFSSDIAVFKEFRGNGIGTLLVQKSHDLYEAQKVDYKNPKAIIEVKSKTMLKARKALGYEVVDKEFDTVKVAKV
jgi:GNAT superfamily N-acetyltransferase